MLERKTLPERRLLLELADELLRAGQHGDWPRLASVDAALADQAARWAPRAQWGVAERAALDTLRLAHEAARHACAASIARLDRTLLQMREGRSRWLAYAESGAWLEEEQQEEGRPA